MTDLELALRELDVEWPATPDIATAVQGRLEARPVGASRWRRRRRVRAGRAGAAVRRDDGGLARGPHRRAALAGPEERGDQEGDRCRPPVRARRSTSGTPTTVAGAARRRLARAGPAGPRRAAPASTGRRCRPARPLPRSSMTARSWCRRSARRRRRSSRRPSGSADAGRAAHRRRQARVLASPARTGSPIRRRASAGYEDQRIAGNTLLVEGDGCCCGSRGELTRERAVEIARSVE